MLYKINNKKPKISKNTFIAPSADIIGDVHLNENVSIWFNTTLRGDDNSIIIGTNSNVQDNSIIHTIESNPTVIGNNVTIGHGAIIHGCTIEDDCLIGMGAIILNRATIKSGSIIAAGTVIAENTLIPSSSLVMGIPGKIIKTVSEEHKMMVTKGVFIYKNNIEAYKNLKKISFFF